MRARKTGRPDGSKARRYNLKSKFGITPEQYDEAHAKQAGGCAICRVPGSVVTDGKLRRLAVDHDADTGTIRGLLCGRCNPGLGMFMHSPELLERAAAYLRSSSPIVMHHVSKDTYGHSESVVTYDTGT